jgi:hypothetical protein
VLTDLDDLELLPDEIDELRSDLTAGSALLVTGALMVLEFLTDDPLLYERTVLVLVTPSDELLRALFTLLL